MKDKRRASITQRPVVQPPDKQGDGPARPSGRMDPGGHQSQKDKCCVAPHHHVPRAVTARGRRARPRAGPGPSVSAGAAEEAPQATVGQLRECA